jgi:hypothetical protein
VDFDTPDHIPVSGNFLLEAKEAGTYTERIVFLAEPDPGCDPTQGKILLEEFFFICLFNRTI